MSADAVTRIEKLRSNKFSEEEAARLREIGSALNLRPDDAVWDIVAAMEYQRVFYEALPEKITGASTEILRSISVTAEKEAAAAQARLADCVVEQAQRLSTKINYTTLLPMGIAALICLLAHGSMLLWAGFRIGSGKAHPLALCLYMPSGLLVGGLCLAAGLFFGILAARGFASEEKGWHKKLFTTLSFFWRWEQRYSACPSDYVLISPACRYEPSVLQCELAQGQK
jgi:hypothetical protein